MLKNNFKMLKQQKEHSDKNKRKYLETCLPKLLDKRLNNRHQKYNKTIPSLQKQSKKPLQKAKVKRNKIDGVYLIIFIILLEIINTNTYY